jgi:uncharacterized protein (DUF849 family)
MTGTMRVLELDACTVEFDQDDVAHVHFRENRTVEASDVQAMFDAIATLRQGRKVLLLVTVGEGTAMTNDARAHASSDAGNKLIAADAIVVRDFAHQLAANVFVRHHKPARPIRMFPDKASAREWLLDQHHLI